MQEPPLVSFSMVSRVFERPVARGAELQRGERAGLELQLAVDREPLDLVGHVGAGQADVMQAEVVVAELAVAERRRRGRGRPRAAR